MYGGVISSILLRMTAEYCGNLGRMADMKISATYLNTWNLCLTYIMRHYICAHFNCAIFVELLEILFNKIKWNIIWSIIFSLKSIKWSCKSHRFCDSSGSESYGNCLFVLLTARWNCIQYGLNELLIIIRIN